MRDNDKPRLVDKGKNSQESNKIIIIYPNQGIRGASRVSHGYRGRPFLSKNYKHN